MRSFPFRDWKRTEGFAAFPGWGPVHSIHPLVTEVMREGGVEPTYVTDSPFLRGGRFSDFRRPNGAKDPAPPVLPGEDPSAEDIERDMIDALDRDEAAAERTIDTGIELLGDLARGGPFFLGLDGLDPQDTVEVPAAYVEKSDGEPIRQAGPPYAPIYPVSLEDSTIDRVRERYEDYVRSVDDMVGRLMDEMDSSGLLDRTIVWFLSHNGIALGEHGMMGRAAPTSYREAHFVPYFLRDPEGRRAGDESFYFASTHDVAPTLLSAMDMVIPGKMDGEDLTALLEDEDPPKRHFFTSGIPAGMLAGNNRWLLRGGRRQPPAGALRRRRGGRRRGRRALGGGGPRPDPRPPDRLRAAVQHPPGRGRRDLPRLRRDRRRAAAARGARTTTSWTPTRRTLPSDEDESPGNDPNRRDT